MFVEKEVCPACPWGQEPESPEIHRLLYYLRLMDAGAPVGRHELLDYEWIALGALKDERELISREERAERGKD